GAGGDSSRRGFWRGWQSPRHPPGQQSIEQLRRTEMKRIYGIAAGMAILIMNAAAQDPAVDKVKIELEKMVATSKVFAVSGGVMGRTVKGAPYSGQEVNENSQMLADGTRIHNETRATVYRDSEGRVRRETGEMVTIWDPVANVNYTLNSKNMTAEKSPMPPA